MILVHNFFLVCRQCCGGDSNNAQCNSGQLTSPFTTAAQWAATTAHGDIAADYNGQNGFTSATYIAEAAARMIAEDAEIAAEQEAMMAAYNNQYQTESSDYDFEEGDNGQFGFGFGMNGKLIIRFNHLSQPNIFRLYNVFGCSGTKSCIGRG